MTGIGLLVPSPRLYGSDPTDFLRGVLFGIVVGTILIGVFLATRSIFEYLSQND